MNDWATYSVSLNSDSGHRCGDKPNATNCDRSFSEPQCRHGSMAATCAAPKDTRDPEVSTLP